MGYPRPKEVPELVIIDNQWGPAPWWGWDEDYGEWKCLACPAVFNCLEMLGMPPWEQDANHYRKCWQWAVQYKNFPEVAKTFERTCCNPNFKWVETPPKSKGSKGDGKGKGKGKDANKERNDAPPGVPPAPGLAVPRHAAADDAWCTPVHRVQVGGEDAPGGEAAPQAAGGADGDDSGDDEDISGSAAVQGACGVYAGWATASALKEQLDQCVEEIKTLRTEVTETKATIGTVSEKLDQVQLIKVALDTISEKVSTLGQLQQIQESLDRALEKVNTLVQLQHTNQVVLGAMEREFEEVAARLPQSASSSGLA